MRAARQHAIARAIDLLSVVAGAEVFGVACLLMTWQLPKMFEHMEEAAKVGVFHKRGVPLRVHQTPKRGLTQPKSHISPPNPPRLSLTVCGNDHDAPRGLVHVLRGRCCRRHVRPRGAAALSRRRFEGKEAERKRGRSGAPRFARAAR